MLLRSSSTPILNSSWTPPHYNNINHYCTPNTSKDSSSPLHDHNNTHELNIPYLPRTNFISTLSHDHYRLPHSKPAMDPVFETRQHAYDLPPPLEVSSSTPLHRLFSSSGLDEVVVGLEDGGAGGSDGGGGGGGSGFNECGNSSSNYHGHGSMEAYYKKMIQMDPRNSLILGNYAMFLKEVHGDIVKAEEYCERAILTSSPSDAKVLCSYADIIWQTHSDARRAETYFDQAVQSDPNDCYVLVWRHMLNFFGTQKRENEKSKTNKMI